MPMPPQIYKSRRAAPWSRQHPVRDLLSPVEDHVESTEPFSWSRRHPVRDLLSPVEDHVESTEPFSWSRRHPVRRLECLRLPALRGALASDRLRECCLRMRNPPPVRLPESSFR